MKYSRFRQNMQTASEHDSTSPSCEWRQTPLIAGQSLATLQGELLNLAKNGKIALLTFEALAAMVDELNEVNRGVFF